MRRGGERSSTVQQRASADNDGNGSSSMSKFKDASEEGMSSIEATFNLVNGILGVGVLGYPYCFKECGIILSICIIIGCFTVCVFSARLLLISSQLSGKRAYEELASYTYGATGRRMVKLSVSVINLGALVAYLNVIADVLSAVAGTVIPPSLEPSRNSIIAGVAFFGALPMGLFVQDANALGIVSTITVAFIFVFAILLLFWGFTPVQGAGKVLLWEPNGALVAFPVMAYGFTMHTIIFPVYNLLRSPTTARMQGAILRGMLVCTLVYATVGAGGYLTYGERTSGDILRNLGAIDMTGMRGVIERVSKVGYGLNILGTVPLVVLPVQELLMPMHGPGNSRRNGGGWQKRATRQGIAFGMIGIALVLALIVPNVEFILGLNGATTGVTLAYIMPALIYLKVSSMAENSLLVGKYGEDGRERSWRRKKAFLLLAFGIMAGIVCTRATLNAVHKEQEVVQIVQDIVELKGDVDGAAVAEQRAKEVVKTVDVVESAAKELGGVQGDAQASLEALQGAAAALNATISKNGTNEPAPLWNIQAQVEQHLEAREEKRAFDAFFENLQAVTDHANVTLLKVSLIRQRLATVTQEIRKERGEGTEGNATATSNALETERISELVQELDAVLGVELKSEEEAKGGLEQGLKNLDQELDAAVTALKETLEILKEVQVVVTKAKEHGTKDAQLKQEAISAMERAADATAASTLALDLTAEALHWTAVNQTSELMEVLTGVVTDLSKTKQRSENSKDGTSSTADAAENSQKEPQAVILTRPSQKSTQKSADQINNDNDALNTEQLSGDLNGKAKKGTKKDPSVIIVATVDKTGEKEKGASDKAAKDVIEQLNAVVTDKNGSEEMPGDSVNVTALVQAAQATLNVAKSSKEDAIKEMQGAVENVHPELFDKVGQITKELGDAKMEDGTDTTGQGSFTKTVNATTQNVNGTLHALLKQLNATKQDAALKQQNNGE